MFEQVPQLSPEKREAGISEKVTKLDKPSKSFTGRVPEDLELDTGIKPERMFPEDKKILYVGDPYMVMGRVKDDPNFTTIDYEYGDQSDFICNEMKFWENIVLKGDEVIEKIQTLVAEYFYADDCNSFANLLKEVLPKMETAQEISKKAMDTDFEDPKNDGLYKEVIEAWKDVVRTIADQRSYLREELRNIERNPGAYSAEDDLNMSNMKDDLDDIWYSSINMIRGFEDLPDFYRIVLPQVNKLMEETKRKEKEEAGEGAVVEEWSEEKEIDFIWKHSRDFSDKIRPKREKQPKKSNVAQAIFPQLPFKEETFDRFVASWSLSTHLFEGLEKDEFKACWREIMRVLSEDGEAFIFPLTYRGFSENKETMVESLKEYSEEDKRFVWELWFSERYKIDPSKEDIDSAVTLFIKKIKEIEKAG